MTVRKTDTGTKNPDGSTRFFHHFKEDPDFPGLGLPEGIGPGHIGAILHTGPITGTIVLADGTAYDVTDQCIAVRSEHLLELEDAIHKAHHVAGRFLDCPLPPE